MTDEELLQKLDKNESGHRDLNGIVGDLRDAMTVTAAIQRRQAKSQRTQAEEIVAAQEEVRLARQEASAARESVAVLRTAVELAVKLNGLIGHFDNRPRQQPQRRNSGELRDRRREGPKGRKSVLRNCFC